MSLADEVIADLPHRIKLQRGRIAGALREVAKELMDLAERMDSGRGQNTHTPIQWSATKINSLCGELSALEQIASDAEVKLL